jgi:ABC-type polar amino acid transport system ATPase subunit
MKDPNLRNRKGNLRKAIAEYKRRTVACVTHESSISREISTTTFFARRQELRRELEQQEHEVIECVRKVDPLGNIVYAIAELLK